MIDDFRPKRIVSGGQTGVDRSALIAAAILKIDHGGYCPMDRIAEDGEIPACYPMTECESRDYLVRTRLNIEHSDATLVLLHEYPPSGGTKRTIEFARALERPYASYQLDFTAADDYHRSLARSIRAWWRFLEPTTLNVGGPRESKAPGIQDLATYVLLLALQTPAHCICGRDTPDFVWEKAKARDLPVKCSKCGHVTRWDDFLHEGIDGREATRAGAGQAP